MAVRTAKLYQGEDMSPVLDYTDFVIWEESEFGTRAWRGEGNPSTIVIRDPLGEQGSGQDLPSGLTAKSLASKNLFVVELGTDYMFRGRVGIKNYSRDGQLTERYRQVEVSLHDTNWDLDHIFVHGYARPSETDIARAQGIIASYLSGAPRPSTALNGSNFLSGSNTVTLDAQTYNRTTPLEILREISVTANKQFFVTGDTIGGGSLFWDGNDSAAYRAGLRISDRPDEIDSTCGSAAGASCSLDPSALTAIDTPNGNFETGLTTDWLFDHISGGLASPGLEGTYKYGVNGGGFSYYFGWSGFTFTAGTTYVVRWLGGVPGVTFFFGNVNEQDQATAVGNTGCIEWTPSVDTDATDVYAGIGSATLNTWEIDGLQLYVGGGSEALTTCTFPPIWNVGPASTEDGSEQVSEVVLFYGSGGDQYVIAENDTVANLYAHSSIVITDDKITSEAEAQKKANAILAHRQYEDKTYNVTVGPLTDDQVLLVKHGQTIQIKARAIPDADDQFRTMRIVQCRYTTPVQGTWFAHLQLGRPWKMEPYSTGPTLTPKSGVAADTDPGIVGATGDPGTDNGEYAAGDHGHAHGNITTGGPYHMAEDVTIADAGGHFTGGSVEAALQELGAGGGGSGPDLSDDTPLVESGTGSAGTSADASRSDHVHPADAGGGSPWTLAVDEDGSSVAGWTVIDGTWSSSGGVILADNDGDAAYRSLRYDTKVPFGLGIVAEVDIEFPTAGQGAGLDVIAGIAFAGVGTTSDLFVSFDLYVNRDWLLMLQDVTNIRRTFTPTLNLDTTYTMRVAMNGPFYSVWLDGTLLGSGEAGVYINGRAGDYLMLYTYNSRAEFSNIKVWHTTLPS